MQKDRSRNWDQRFDAERFWQRYEQRERKRSIERTARILILLFAVLAPFFLVMFVIVVAVFARFHPISCLTCKGCSIVQSITCSVLQISGK